MTRACSFPGCGRDARGHGLCVSHARQRRRGSELTPLPVRLVTPCTVAGCDREAVTHGQCATHSRAAYRRAAKAQPADDMSLTSLGPVAPADPAAMRAAAVVLAGVALRLDAVTDLGRVLESLGLRGAS